MTLGDTLAGVVQGAQASPRSWMRWLPVQDRYRRSRAARRLLRAGNQSTGKTTVGLADLLDQAEGIHPHRDAPAAGEYWVICASWSQSVAIQTKLWDLLDQDRVKPGTIFNPKLGFRGKHPSVQVRHESGEYSIIRFKTTRQGTLDLASATILGALFDEVPLSQAVYSEVVKRVQASGGWVSICMTPIGAPVEWVQEEVKAGRLEDIHTRLTPEAMIPVGARWPLRLQDGTPCDDDWIRRVEADTPEHEREVRVHGGWEIRSSGRYFATFASTGSAAHVHDRVPVGRVTVCLGIDHGTLPGKQIAHLVLVQTPATADDLPSVYVLDSYVDVTGNASPRDDAMGILAMLRRHGMGWESLDHVYGDKVHMPGSGSQKSNRDLQAQVAKALKIPDDALRPAIRTVKRGQGRGSGSLSTGCRWLYHAITRHGLGVHPRCTRLIAALDRYDIAVDDDWKDPIDALRYALDAFIFGGWRRGASVVRFG